MSSDAWVLPPDRYLALRPPACALPAQPSSCYVTMRDGCRIAVDVYLPQGDEVADRLPALLFFTPYYRRFRLKDGSAADPNPNTGLFRDFFVPRGYAVVVVDVRGTGASFGTRDGFRSPAERNDHAEIADWVVAQAWSNGRIGATGISYLGAAADFLASTGHPAVKAIAPLFSVWDTYADNYFPGGLQIKSLTERYDRLMVAMDHDRREMLGEFAAYACPDFIGPQPVDDDPDGRDLALALREHRDNFRQGEFMADLRYREEGLPYDPGYSSATISPYSYIDTLRPDVAVLSVSGWMDGAGYANGAIARFLTLKDNPRHLLLGPWDHGARADVSPWREAPLPVFPWRAEVLRFFDTYLMGRDTGLRDEAPVHVFAMHEERWHAADTWPPHTASQTLYPAPDGRLSAAAPAPATVGYKVDSMIGTGQQTRYERISGLNCPDYYTDWQGRTAGMLGFDSAPLERPLTLAGHVLAELDIAIDTPDAALFVYLTECEADGTERYITEGVLRALHRAELPPPDHQRVTWPWRPFRRDTARPWPAGAFERLRIPLLPTAWQVQPGSRLRLSLAGADADHFGKVPHGRAPVLTLRLGSSALVLPVLEPS